MDGVNLELFEGEGGDAGDSNGTIEARGRGGHGGNSEIRLIYLRKRVKVTLWV